MDVEPSNADGPIEDDLGWKTVSHKKKTKGPLAPPLPYRPKSQNDEEFDPDDDDLSPSSSSSKSSSVAEIRRRLLKELAARMHRDTQLRYAQREFELQRAMMGKGARQKITATEKMGDEDEDSEEDLDALDARGGKPSKSKAKTVNEDTYKPRVYKWKLERKR